MKSKKFILSVGVSLILSACHLSGKGGGTQTGYETELTGTWNTACSLAGTGSYLKHSMVYETSGITSTESYFADSSCSSPTYTRISTGTYTIGGVSVGLSTAKDLNFDYTGLSITLYSQALVTQYKSLRTCGTEDWSLGVAVDCGESYVDDVYQIYVLSAPNLILGLITSTWDGTSAELRPRATDPLHVFIKQ